MPRDAHFRTALVRAEQAGSWRDRRHGSWTLPPDLLAEAVRRLRPSALLYAAAYFLAGLLPPLLVPEARAVFLSAPSHWLPAVLSITGALALAGLASRPRIPDRLKAGFGLVFEVLGSFGIAAAEYQHVTAPIVQGAMGPSGFGLSWVAAWVLLFSVVVPTPPRIALVAATFAVAAVPLTYAAGVALGSNLPLWPRGGLHQGTGFRTGEAG